MITERDKRIYEMRSVNFESLEEIDRAEGITKERVFDISDKETALNRLKQEYELRHPIKYVDYWKTRDEVKVKISEMTDKHLQNTIRMLERKIYDAESDFTYAEEGLAQDYALDVMDDDDE